MPEAPGAGLAEPPQELHLAGVDPCLQLDALLLGQPALFYRGIDASLQRVPECVLELARLDVEAIGRVVEDGATLVGGRERARGGDGAGHAQADREDDSSHDRNDDLGSRDPGSWRPSDHLRLREA